MQAEAQLRAGAADEDVLAVLAQLPADAPVALHTRAGDCYLALDALDASQLAYERAAGDTDALYGLGLVASRRGDSDRAIELWLDVRNQDLVADRPVWTLTAEAFDETAERALASLPEPIRMHLENVPILAHDYPDEALVREGWDPRMLGFFSGVPLPEKEVLGEGPQFPDCALLFQRNIERDCDSPVEAMEQVRITLLHETGHFFGLSDDDLEEMGLG